MAISQSGNNAVPAPNKVAVASNYLDFATAGQANWSQQFLPDLIEEEAEAYGKRTISGFLAQVGAEESMTSDQVVWSEQGRLHLKYSGAIHSATNVIDGLPSGHAIRLGDTIVISCPTKNKTFKAYVSDQDTSSTSITVAPYTVSALIGSSAGQGGLLNDDAVDVFVYGSEFTKGTSGRTESISSSVQVIQ